MVVFFLMIVEKKGKKRRHPSLGCLLLREDKSSIYHLVTNFTLKWLVLPFVGDLDSSGASLLMVKV